MKFKFIIILLFNCFAFSQTKSLLDNVQIDNQTKLIGMYPHFDKDKTYEYLNFYINDKNVIKALIEKLTYGKIKKNYLEQKNYRIVLLQKNEEVENWLVNPAYSNVIVNGVYYDFDIATIKELAEKYPFKYTFYKKTFSNINKYTEYVTKLRNDKSFLFDYEPSFKYEGSFEIEFPKNKEFDSPKTIDNFLRPKITEISKNSEFSISYVLNEYNLKNNNQFTITIKGDKDIYDKLVLYKMSKKNWKNNEASAIFFMKN